MTRDEAITLARQVIDKYGADADKPSVHLAKALLDGAHERDGLRRDARRYRRLRVLGCAPYGTTHLGTSTVMRFSNLDEHVDADIDVHPSRGEAD